LDLGLDAKLKMAEKLLKEEEKSEEKGLRLNFSFPKFSKIRKKNDFKAFNLSKKRLKGCFLILDYRFNKTISNPRLGISISSKTAKANVRNKFKRQIREIFRLNQYKLDKNLEILVIAKPFFKNLKYQDLKKDFLNLIFSL